MDLPHRETMMKIGEVARSVGLEPSAIRFYEISKVVPEPGRTEAGYREYTETDVELLRFVRRLRSLELPLDDVREIVSLRTSGQAPCVPVREAIAREADTIDRRITELKSLQEELIRLRAAADEIRDEWPNSCVCHVVQPDG